MLNASTERVAVKLLTDLLQVESPTFKEERAVKLLEDYTHKLGFEKITVDPVGNLIAEVGRGDRVLLLAGHIDTIDKPLPARYEDGKLVGRGAVDAKGPLAAMTIAAYLASKNLDLSSLRIVLAALVGEEGPSHGAHNLVGKVNADYIIVGEPTGLDGVVIGCRGSCKLKVECKGYGGHTASPQLYKSPCTSIIKIYEALGDIGNGYTLTPVYLGCGDSKELNVIPKKAVLIANARIPIEGSSGTLRSTLERLMSEHEDCMWSLEDCTEPFRTSPNNPAVRAVVRALVQLGLKPRLAYKAGTSDMVVLSKITNNIVEIGPGRPELSHTDYEWIDLNGYLRGIDVYYRTIENLTLMRGEVG